MSFVVTLLWLLILQAQVSDGAPLGSWWQGNFIFAALLAQWLINMRCLSLLREPWSLLGLEFAHSCLSTSSTVLNFLTCHTDSSSNSNYALLVVTMLVACHGNSIDEDAVSKDCIAVTLRIVFEMVLWIGWSLAAAVRWWGRYVDFLLSDNDLHDCAVVHLHCVHCVYLSDWSIMACFNFLMHVEVFMLLLLVMERHLSAIIKRKSWWISLRELIKFVLCLIRCDRRRCDNSKIDPRG